MICFLWFLWHFLTFCTLFEPIVPQPCCILNHLITQQQLYVFTLEAYSCCLISLPTGEGRGGALLHHDLFAIDNVDTLRGILHLAALDVVDAAVRRFVADSANTLDSSHEIVTKTDIDAGTG